MLTGLTERLGAPDAGLPLGVPPLWADRLRELLQPLDDGVDGDGRAGLASDIFRYVLYGEPKDVLKEAPQRTAVARHLRLSGFCYGRGSRELPDVYEHLNDVPPVVALRWARLLDASMKGSGACFIDMPRDATWPEVLLMASTESSLTGGSSQRPVVRDLRCSLLEAMLQEDGLEPASMLMACFASDAASYRKLDQRALLLTDLVDYPQALARHVEAVRPLLLAPSAGQRLHVLGMLDRALPDTLDELAPQLCELAVSSSKPVRSLAGTVLRRLGPAVWQPLRELAIRSKPEQRGHALSLLHALGTQRSASMELEFAARTAAADKAPSVQALAAEWDVAARSGVDSDEALQFVMPVADWSAQSCRLPDGVLEQLWHDVNAAIAQSNAAVAQRHARSTAQGHAHELQQECLFTTDDERALRAYMESGEATLRVSATVVEHRAWRHVGRRIVALSGTDGVTPATSLKLLNFFGLVNSTTSLSPFAVQTVEALRLRGGRPSLLELSCMLTDAGMASEVLLRSYCSAWGAPLAMDWPDADVWPYVAHHLDAVLRAVREVSKHEWGFDRAGLFRALATLPALPPTAVSTLFDVALGTAKTDRPLAQSVLDRLPDKEARIVSALTDGRAERRAIAATWLARLRHSPAVPALEVAVTKERHDVAKGAMLDALQALGQPVEKYLDRAALAAEATKALAKEAPKELSSFPWEALPDVRWADESGPVPRSTLRWLIVQAVKQKSSEPNAVLRKFCAMFQEHDREAFGQFLLEYWLAEDVRPISAVEAEARAEIDAESLHASMTSYPQYFDQHLHFGKSVEELTAALLPSRLLHPAGSAIGSKGLLAVAAACALDRAAAPTQRYLKAWYGTRAAQGKALIAMLAWIDHPSATQLMLAIGSRFRTKSFQEEATRQAEAMAERKGWTLAELADRTVPSAGFDETGTLDLSFGQRTFTARLLADFKVELFNPEGKKVAALPDPRQDDDADLAAQAKKAFGNAKKELKAIVGLQTDRLYEALCTEREWPGADWRLYLQQHPVLRHLVQRLVWVECVGGVVGRTFRPLDDGTLTDVEDNALSLHPEATVRLAHDSLLDAKTAAAWQLHLVDYEVKPLFQQLGKGVYVLPEGRGNDDAIKDFEGHLIEAFALRGRALKLGYTRGAAEDGGWFHVYEKRFPTLGLQAVIRFTGNGLPEENRTVALLHLSFVSSAGSPGGHGGGMALSRVPRVLLSECCNDLRLLAAEGTGFDTDWQKKTEY